jgi:hypothetical protein
VRYQAKFYGYFLALNYCFTTYLTAFLLTSYVMMRSVDEMRNVVPCGLLNIVSSVIIKDFIVDSLLLMFQL